MPRLHTLAHTLAVAGTAAAALALAAGCHDDNQPKYGSVDPSKPAMSQDGSPTMMPGTTMLPAGATQLATGTYNQIRFVVPQGSGQLYIMDEDTKSVVGSTNSVSANAGTTMTMADLKNTAQGLNMADRFGIYFAPTHATTMPIGGGSGM